MHTRILTPDRDGLAAAAALLREGRLVAFPTETVYGLGANALDEAAVRRVYEVKGRPTDNPMIVHVHDRRQALELMPEVPVFFAELANEFWPGPLTMIVHVHDRRQALELMQEVPVIFAELANEFWPGPLTMIVRHNAAVPDAVTAGLDTLALRLPDHQVTRELLRLADVPVAAPSANVSGRPSPTDAHTVLADLDGRIDAIVDGGPCTVGIESTVLDLTSRIPTILRPGTVTREDLEDVLQTHVAEAGSDAERPLSPGMKYRHYAPKADLLVFDHRDDEAMRAALCAAIREHTAAGRPTGLLAPDRLRGCGEDAFASLGDGTPVDYARGIYSAIRRLDDLGMAVIVCPGIALTGIGVAVMNRLGKAGRRGEG